MIRDVVAGIHHGAPQDVVGSRLSPCINGATSDQSTPARNVIIVSEFRVVKHMPSRSVGSSIPDMCTLPYPEPRRDPWVSVQ
jgi:hypothetical protein